MSQDERNAHARRLINEAGYGPDNPLQIELRYNTSDTQQRIALAIQSMWKDALGVEDHAYQRRVPGVARQHAAREVTQVFRSSWIGDYNDAHTFLSIMESDNPANSPLMPAKSSTR